MCRAIEYAHSRGVIHRDLKPANVMLGPYGETLVVDWGLAKAVGRGEDATNRLDEEPTLRPTSGGDSAETQDGEALGTPAYMPPEQAAGRLALMGPPSDVYSLGATLYALLTGQKPFTGDVATMLREVEAGRFAPPREVNPRVPRALNAVVLKAMSREPAARYASAQALADDLESWLADEPVAAWKEPAAVRARRWSRCWS